MNLVQQIKLKLYTKLSKATFKLQLDQQNGKFLVIFLVKINI